MRWTANASRKIALSRNRKDNPNGWSPLIRLMRLKVKVLGAILKRLERDKDIMVCLSLYKEVKHDMKETALTEEEAGWLEENDIKRTLPKWSDLKKDYDHALLAREVKHLDKMTSSKMRRELRLKHDEMVRKIQEEADKGKIGRVLKSIMNEGKDFSLEVIHGEERNITDADKLQLS